MTELKIETQAETDAAINTMAASASENITLIEDMASALLLERPDMREIVDQHVRAMKQGIVEQYFASVFYEDQEHENRP